MKFDRPKFAIFRLSGMRKTASPLPGTRLCRARSKAPIPVNESIEAIMRLLDEVVAHLKADSAADRTAARKKLERISALSGTMALTLKVKY